MSIRILLVSLLTCLSLGSEHCAEKEVAVAVSEMLVGGGIEATVNGVEHVIGQVMPAGTDITVPRPVPAMLMPRDACVGLTNIRLRWADTPATSAAVVLPDALRS